MSRQLNIELTDAERAMIEGKAKAGGLSMRGLIVRAVAAFEPPEPTTPDDRHCEVIDALNRIADRVLDVERAVNNIGPYR